MSYNAPPVSSRGFQYSNTGELVSSGLGSEVTVAAGVAVSVEELSNSRVGGPDEIEEAIESAGVGVTVDEGAGIAVTFEGAETVIFEWAGVTVAFEGAEITVSVAGLTESDEGVLVCCALAV